MREHLTAALRSTPAVLADLIGPPLPPVAEHAWRAFSELSGTRAVGMHGASRITYAEIAAYDRLTEAGLSPLDLDLIRVADEAFLADLAERAATTPSTEPG